MFSYQLCKTALVQMANKSSALQIDSIAKTSYHRQILAAKIGAGPRRILLAAAFHANEWITTLVLLRYCRELCAAPPDTTVLLLPLMNPDGIDLVTGALPTDTDQYRNAAAIAAKYPQIPFPLGWKANGNGVDLNLNFPANFHQAVKIKGSLGFRSPAPCNWPGFAPLDQPETQALAELTQRFSPDLVVALHTQGQEIYWHYNTYNALESKQLGLRMAAVSGYQLCSPPPGSSYAGYKDWFIQHFQRPGYTVEAGWGTNPLPTSQFPELYRQVQPILQLAITG